MRRYLAGTWLLAIFFFGGPAFGESGVIEKVGSFFDTLTRGLSEVGKKTEDVIRPSFGPLDGEVVDFSNLVQYPREVRESHPIAHAARVSKQAFADVEGPGLNRQERE